MEYRNHRGFSLIELSIVLVILGLLVGGILSGRSLIRAAQLRSITSEYHQIQTAVYTFRLTYGATPGDMPNATDIWGLARSGAPCSWFASDGPVSPSGGTATCNGDGSGDLMAITRTPPLQGRSTHEEALFWSHLSNAGLIESLYATYPRQGIIGMQSRYSGGAWGVGIGWESPFALTALFLKPTASTNFRDWVVLTPEDAWSIDKKIDDGKPFSGEVKVLGAADGNIIYQPNCTEMPNGDSPAVTSLRHQVTSSLSYTYWDFSTVADAFYKTGHSDAACYMGFSL